MWRSRSDLDPAQVGQCEHASVAGWFGWWCSGGLLCLASWQWCYLLPFVLFEPSSNGFIVMVPQWSIAVSASCCPCENRDESKWFNVNGREGGSYSFGCKICFSNQDACCALKCVVTVRVWPSSLFSWAGWFWETPPPFNTNATSAQLIRVHTVKALTAKKSFVTFISVFVPGGGGKTTCIQTHPNENQTVWASGSEAKFFCS